MTRTIGIVGAEYAKFSASHKMRVRRLIADCMREYDIVVSGACPLGGVDSWAALIGRERGKPVVEYPPSSNNWEGFRARNLQIADASDHVVCIVVDKLPAGYRGRRFDLCYHCGVSDHVKSGGCWTAWKAVEMGKTAELIILQDRFTIRRALITKGISKTLGDEK